MGRRAESPTLPDGLVEAIGGVGYLKHRPSFVRLAARCKRLANHRLTRAEYDLMRLPVRKIRELLKLTLTRTGSTAVGVVWFGAQPAVYAIRDGVCSIDGRLFSAEAS